MNFKHITFIFTIASLAMTTALQSQTPFWAEDFSGGGIPAGWTNADPSGNNALWTWCGDPANGQGDGCPSLWNDALNEQGPFQATTADNGFVTMDSDLVGEIPSDHQSQLTTSAIDCSDRDQVWLRFENHIGVYTQPAETGAIIRVSTNLTDWTDLTIFPGLTTEERWSENPQVVVVDISEAAADQSQVYIQWQWTGNYEYHWNLDDIGLYEANPTPRHNLRLSQSRLAFNFATPAPMVDTVRFATVVANAGLDPQTNIVAAVSVQADNGDAAFSTDQTLEVLAPDSSEVFDFEEFYLPNGTEGIYTVVYTVGQDSIDAIPGNNSDTSIFLVTADLFAKDNGAIASSTQPLGVGGPWEIGNYYIVPAAGYEAYQAVVSVASNDDAHQGQSVTVFLYEITEDDDPDNFTDADVSVLGFGTYNFTTEENYDIVEVELIDLDSGEPGIELKEGVEYLLMIQYTADMFAPFSNISYDYDVATVVKDDAGSWFLGGFGPGTTVLARMRIRSMTVAAGDLQLDDAQVHVFPNPAESLVNVDVSLREPSQFVELRLLDTRGQVIHSKVQEGVQNERFSFDISKLPTGAYILYIRTDEGHKARKITVQR